MTQRSAYKKALIWTGATAGALLVIAFVAVAFVVDWNKYKETLADLTSDRLGVQVELGGDLRLSFLPRPTLVANGVRLSPIGAQNRQAIATADQIGMRLGLFAALSGDLQLQSLELDGIDTTVVETIDGWRLDGWPDANETSDQDTASSRISLDRIQITGGKIEVLRLGGEAYQLEGLNLDLSGSLPNGPLEWEGSVFLAQEQVQTSGRITPTRSGDLAVKVAVSAVATQLEFSGRMGDETALTGRVQLDSADISKVADFAGVLVAPNAAVNVPNATLKLDLQVEHSAGISNIVSRRFSLNDSVGQIDLTVAGGSGTPNITGSLTLGILALDPFVEALGEQNEGGDTPVVTNTRANEGAESPAMVGGTIDVSVESVSLRGSVIQNVEATLGMNADGPFVDRLQALLPGASRFLYLANSGENTGTLTFETSRLREVLAWSGVSLPAEIPAGRLMTAGIKTELVIDEDTWSFQDIVGRFDTSTVTGSLKGGLGPFSLSQIDIAVDQLNLDAYWPENTVAAGSGGTADAIELKLLVDELRFRSEDYQNLTLQGEFAADSFRLEKASVLHRGGMLTASGERRLTSGGTQEIDANVAVKNWHFPIISALYGSDYTQFNALVATAPYDGSLRLSGPLSQLQTNVTVRNPDREVVLAGQTAVSEPISLRMQGSYSDSKLLDLLDKVGPATLALKDTEVPKTSVSVVLDGAADDLTYSVSGAFLGGQLDIEGATQPTSTSAEVTYSVEDTGVSALNSVLGPYRDLLPNSGARRARARVGISGADIMLDDLSVRAGAEEVSGNLNFQGILSNKNDEMGEKLTKMSGKLAVLGIKLDRMLDAIDAIAANVPDAGQAKITSQPTNPLTGELDLTMRDVELRGQRLNAENAVLQLAQNNSVTFQLGQGASLNEKALTGSVSYQPEGGALRANLNAESLDVGGLLRTMGAGRVMSGSVSLQTALEAEGSSFSKLLSSLSGDLSLSGSAGSMYFMAVQELVTTINSAQNPTAFLTTIGGLLRSGQTDFAAIEGAVRLDAGVALVDKLRVSGGWGDLSLDGQMNFPADLMNLKGDLTLSNPVGAPALPVVFEGSLSSPTTRWASRALERFAIAGIERRIRNRIFGELETAQGQSGGPPASPGTAILGTAFGLLDKLKKRQEEKKLQEAAKEAAAQETEGQRP